VRPSGRRDLPYRGRPGPSRARVDASGEHEVARAYSCTGKSVPRRAPTKRPKETGTPTATPYVEDGVRRPLDLAASRELIRRLARPGRGGGFQAYRENLALDDVCDAAECERRGALGTRTDREGSGLKLRHRAASAHTIRLGGSESRRFCSGDEEALCEYFTDSSRRQ